MTHSLLGNPDDTKADFSPEARRQRGSLGLIKCLKRINYYHDFRIWWKCLDWRGNKTILEMMCLVSDSIQALASRETWRNKQTEGSRTRLWNCEGRGTGNAECGCHHLLPHSHLDSEKVKRSHQKLQAAASLARTGRTPCSPGGVTDTAVHSVGGRQLPTLLTPLFF